MNEAPLTGYQLDALRDRRHWSYKIPGVVTWSLILAAVILAAAEPQWAHVIFRVAALYALLRMAVITFFYFVGLARWRREEMRAALEAAVPLDDADLVHHVVIVPNYKEPIDILRRTLTALAQQQDAARCITVVLAMEAKENDGPAKARMLQSEFGSRFAHILATYHPSDLPGEVPGKSSNERWAAIEAKRTLVDQQGLSPDWMTITSCDADTLFHPLYFSALTRAFLRDPARHYRFWQAPMSFTANAWQVPAPVRIISMFVSGYHLAELANPLAINFPISTYSLSMKLAMTAGFWDGGVIAEDYHMYLRCFFATGGKVRLRPILLPNRGDAVVGDTVWQAIRNFYNQRMRHMWGAEDVAYVAQQYSHWTRVPVHRLFLNLVNLATDHIMLAALPAILTFAALVNPLLANAPAANPAVFGTMTMATLPSHYEVLNVVVVAGTYLTWAIEHLRARRTAQGWQGSALAAEMVGWLFLPLLTIAFVALPALHAQTQMMSGSWLVYTVAPKKLDPNVLDGGNTL